MTTVNSASVRLHLAREAILTEWEREVRQTIAPARTEEQFALRSSHSEVLGGIAAMLDSRQLLGSSPAGGNQLALGHGEHRARNTSYSLEHVIDEYHVLGRVLFRSLEQGGYELSRSERELVWEALFFAIKTAAVEFERVRDEECRAATHALDRSNIELSDALGRKSTEAVLKEQLLTTIFDRVEDYAIFSLDAAGNITSWAKGAQKIKQFSEEEVIGRHFSMLYPKEGQVRDEPMKHLAMAERAGRFRGEGLRQRKNGELFLADVFISPMHQDGKLLGFFKIVADLSERNRIIQERDLSRTRASSLELDKELREKFLFALSHDLRNPIAGAKLRAQQIAIQGCNVAQHQALATRSIGAMERMDQMISDLLDAGRIKAGEPLALTLEEYDLAKDLLAVCEEAAVLHGDRFRFSAPTALIGFWDRQAMRRIVENLLSNAIKYGDSSAVTLTLEDVQGRVFVTVHNEGPCIEEGEQDTLFNLFRRSASAAAGAQRGWGIGLTLVRGLTEAHQGIVKVISMPGEGTSFILDMPKDARPTSNSDSR